SKRKENENKTMTMEATSAGDAMLDMFKLTGDSLYLNHALGIADTYVRLQASDGSLPVKMDYTTGKPVNDSKAMLHPLLRFFQRFENELNITRYAQAKAKAEDWMDKTALSRFEMAGQFEDISVLGLKPYENLTNCTAAPYASYLLSKAQVTDTDLQNAIDLTRFSEDQFTYWNTTPNEDGMMRDATPCVYEQYKYQTSVDASASNVADAMLALYKATGDQLYLAKGTALVDNFSHVQDKLSGKIPTIWDFHMGKAEQKRPYWINCTYATVNTLLKYNDLLNQ
ncbi:MAG: AGE family epimerase/isomerase, partial [Muribaculaceae bacterium]|nr:AGE family epimerase/isomerase [Muribaculaceae bacterium]